MFDRTSNQRRNVTKKTMLEILHDKLIIALQNQKEKRTIDPLVFYGRGMNCYLFLIYNHMLEMHLDRTAKQAPDYFSKHSRQSLLDTAGLRDGEVTGKCYTDLRSFHDQFNTLDHLIEFLLLIKKPDFETIPSYCAIILALAKAVDKVKVAQHHSNTALSKTHGQHAHHTLVTPVNRTLTAATGMDDFPAKSDNTFAP